MTTVFFGVGGALSESESVLIRDSRERTGRQFARTVWWTRKQLSAHRAMNLLQCFSKRVWRSEIRAERLTSPSDP